MMGVAGGKNRAGNGVSIEERAATLFNDSYRALAVRNDWLFARLLALEWIAGIILAIWITPRAYAGTNSSIHPHVYAALFLGFAIVSLPLMCVVRRPGTPGTRHLIAVAQLLMTGLLIDLTGGRIETHFLIFGSLAFLAFYRDWRILVTASAITAGDHFFRGVILPRSIYGTDVAGAWRWLEHSGYVIFEDVFLIASCLFAVNERRVTSIRQAELEFAEHELLTSQAGLELEVSRRTAELSASYQSLTQEVAERERGSKQLQHAEALLSGVLESSLDGVMAFAAVRNDAGQICDFRWQLANPTAQKLVEKQLEELIGSLLLDLFPGNKTDGLFDAYVEVVETGKALHLEQYYNHDGLNCWLKISAVKLGDGFSVTFGDISATKAAEKQLNQAKEAAEAATRTKSEFLANMSHELRTPITAMVGFADMMLDPDQSQSDQFDGLQTIRRNAKHLLEVINEILDLSKIEAGRMTVERISTELPPLLSDVMSIMRPRAIEKGLELHLRFSDGVPRRVLTDPLRTKQILINLVNNALKFTERGRVELLVASNYDTQSIDFHVIDTGIGIAPDELGKLFQPFTQADSSTTRKFGGTGLGLTISKRFAQMLGGDITVSSAVGVGSTFSAHISGADDGTGERCQLEDALIVPHTGPAQMLVEIGGRVLLAEDGRDNQRFISAMLRKAGVDVTVAENGRVAVDAALASPFDVILMDMQMPVLDGYAASSALRSKGYAGPIIALTAHAMAEDRAKCLNAGCTDYLTKPIDRHLLLQTVAKYIKNPELGVPALCDDAVGSAVAPPKVDALVSTCSNDPVMAEVLSDFISNLACEVEKIRTTIDRQDAQGLRNTLHQLKGAGGSYGFQCLTDAAAVAEMGLIAGGSIDSVKAPVNELLRLIRSVKGYAAIREISK